VLSTSHGLMTDREARERGAGERAVDTSGVNLIEGGSSDVTHRASTIPLHQGRST